MPSPLDQTPFLYQALASPIGIVVWTSDFKLGREKLYAARRQAQDPSLACLQFRASPTSPNEIWIVKGKPNGGD